MREETEQLIQSIITGIGRLEDKSVASESIETVAELDWLTNEFSDSWRSIHGALALLYPIAQKHDESLTGMFFFRLKLSQESFAHAIKNFSWHAKHFTGEPHGIKNDSQLFRFCKRHEIINQSFYDFFIKEDAWEQKNNKPEDKINEFWWALMPPKGSEEDAQTVFECCLEIQDKIEWTRSLENFSETRLNVVLSLGAEALLKDKSRLESEVESERKKREHAERHAAGIENALRRGKSQKRKEA